MKQIFDYKLKEVENARDNQKQELLDDRLELRCIMHRCFTRGKERSKWAIMVGSNNGLVLLY